MRGIERRIEALELSVQAPSPPAQEVDTSWWTPEVAERVAEILRDIGALDEVLKWQQEHYTDGWPT